MEKTKQLSRKKGYQIFFGGLWCAIVVFCVVRMLLPSYIVNFSGMQEHDTELLVPIQDGIWFDADVIDGNAPGWYVDSSMEYGEIFAQTPPVDLKAGSYDVVISYQANDSGNLYTFTDEEKTFRTRMGREKVGLEADRRTVTLKWNIVRAEKGFQVQFSYGGNGYFILNSVEIRQNRDFERMGLFWMSAIFFLLLCWCKIKNRELRLLFWSAAGVTLAASFPLLMYYLPEGDDLFFHLLRIEGMVEAWKSGQFPVRIQPVWMNGYGYPVSVFYAEGMLSAAGFFRLIGFPLQTSYKMYIFFINLFTFLLTWYCMKRMVGDHRIALIGGAVYTLAPYRLINIYLRAALGEYSAMTFFPLVMAGCYEIFVGERNRRRYSWILLALGMTGIIQSHILSTEIVVLTLGVICLSRWKQLLSERRFVELGKAAVAALLLNMEYLVPFLDYFLREKFMVTSDGFGGWIQGRGLFLTQLLNPFPYGWGTDYSAAEGFSRGEPEMASGLGLTFILAGVLFAEELMKRRENISKENQVGKLCLIAGVVLSFMATIWFPWDLLFSMGMKKLFSPIQFPWRLLGEAALFFTVVCCILLKSWRISRGERVFRLLAAVMIGTLVMTTGYFETTMLQQCIYLYIPDVESINSFNLGTKEYVPLGVEPGEKVMPKGKLLYDEAVEIESFSQKGTSCVLICQNLSEKSANVELPLLYYRGYEATDMETGSGIDIDVGENGRIRLHLEGSYQGSVNVMFHEPVLWRAADVVSALSGIAILAYLFRTKGGFLRTG